MYIAFMKNIYVSKGHVRVETKDNNNNSVHGIKIFIV